MLNNLLDRSIIMGNDQAIKPSLSKFRPQFPCLFAFAGYDEYSAQHWLPYINLVSVESAVGAEVKWEKFNKLVLQYLFGIVVEVRSKFTCEFL